MTLMVDPSDQIAQRCLCQWLLSRSEIPEDEVWLAVSRGKAWHGFEDLDCPRGKWCHTIKVQSFHLHVLTPYGEATMFQIHLFPSEVQHVADA